MKKLIYVFALILTFSLITTSCTKQDLPDETVATEPGDSTNPQTPPEDDPDNGEG